MSVQKSRPSILCVPQANEKRPLGILKYSKETFAWLVSCIDNISAGAGISLTGFNSGRPKIGVNLEAGDGIKIETEQTDEFTKKIKISAEESPTPVGSSLTVKHGSTEINDVGTLQVESSAQGTQGENLPLTIGLTGNSDIDEDGDADGTARLNIYATGDNFKKCLEFAIENDEDLQRLIAKKFMEMLTVTTGDGANIEFTKDETNIKLKIDVHYK